MVLLGSKIRLLIWKNSVLRRKHRCETAAMILLPICFIAFQIIVHHVYYSPPKEQSASLGRTFKDGFYISDPYYINIGTSTSSVPYLVTFLTGESKTTTRDIAYSPSSDETSLVMKEVLNLMKGNTSGSSKSAELRNFPSKSTLEKYLRTWKDKPKDWKPFRVAVNFQDKLERIGTSDRTVGYKIRFVDQNFSTAVLRRIDGYRSGDFYKHSGFTALQVLIDKILIEKMTGGLKKDIKLEMQEFPRKVQELPKEVNYLLDWRSRVPPYVYSLQHFIILGFLLCVPNIIRGIISEKRSGIKELMQIMGLPNWMHWMGWMLDCLFILGISATLMTFFLFIPLSNPGMIQFCSVTLWFFIFILYIMAIISFCFFISTFFSQVFLATSMGVYCYLASYYGLVFTMDGSTLGEKMASSLLPNMAFHWAFKVILSFEETGEGAGWSTIADPISETNQLSILPVCGMLILDTILYMTLTMYLERILPSEFGLQKPWYYIFQPSTWILKKSEKPVKKEELATEADAKVSDNRPGFEEDPVGLAVGIEISDLKKRFDGHKMAVDGICAKMYIGEITALLGHNGAGKTTTLSILTGILRPTSGTAIINGYDITTSMEEIRKSLGLCPQQNMLFDELTVEQHLEFFGRLRGLTSEKAKEEAQKIIWSLKMANKMDVESKKLSGGQKRKLCLANAVIGNSSVLILDEPTSGLDPDARRSVWNMLLGLRAGRTIILTTHLMEEADVLGDRIIIMAEGKIQCCGTSLFLKKLYANGYYSIILTTKEGVDGQAILSVVRKYVPEAFIDVSRQKYSKSVFTISLPEEFTSTSIFPHLVDDLDQQKEKLGILTFGCSIATMDDVFIKVGELNNPAEAEDDMEKFEDVSKTGANNCQGIYLLVLMFWGLMIKLFIRNMRNLKLIFVQVFPPIIAIILVCSVASSFLRDVSVPGYASRKISSRSYRDPISICKPMTKEAKSMCQTFSLVIPGVHILPVDEKSLVDFLRQESRTNFEKLKTRYVIAAEMTKVGTEMKIKVMHSPHFHHSEPLAINAISNTVLKLLTNNSAKKIEVTNHPLKTVTAKEVFDAAEQLFGNNRDTKSTYLIAALFGFLVPVSLVMLAASYVIFPTEERLSNGKQMQRMAGVSPWLYWTSVFLGDFVMMSLITIGMLICIYIFQPHQIFTDGDGAGVFLLIFAVYYFSILPITYLTSIFCSTEDYGFTTLVKYHTVTALLYAPITCIFELWGVGLLYVKITALIIRILCSSNPTLGFALSIFKFSILALKINKCNVLPDKEAFCNEHPEYFQDSKLFSGCCKNVSCYKSDKSAPKEIYCHFIQNEDYCHIKEKYLSWEFTDYLQQFVRCDLDKLPGVGQELLVMFITGVVYYILLFLVEYGILKNIKEKYKPSKTKSSVCFAANSDDDVKNEALRVQAQVSHESQGNAGITMIGPEIPIRTNEVDGGIEAETTNNSIEKVETDAVAVEIVGAEEEKDALVVLNLCKAYGDFAVVSNISFGVKHGECFGLLGVNGAGKTTVFRMLTGDETPSFGNAIAEGYTLGNNKLDFLRQFGYCPQFDAIVPFMTGKEILMFYGRLRGVPPKSLKREVDMWLAKLGLTESANVVSKKYSGGMKRRLSAGMALVGHPPIILLDEPTSGVDPISRRQFWEIISSAKESGQAVILTSHSMDECEAVCDRLGIMVNGQFQCFGGIQQLRNNQGHSLTIKLKTKAPQDNEFGAILHDTKIVTNLKYDLVCKFQRVILKDHLIEMISKNVLEFQILDYPISLAAIFKVVEELKGKFEIIEEYSVGDTNLEQVFLSLVRKQKENEEHTTDTVTNCNSTCENMYLIFCPLVVVCSNWLERPCFK